MSTHNVDKIRVGLHRSENTETASSPHTYAHGGSRPSPATTLPDKPTISNMTFTSAVAGLPPNYFARGANKSKRSEEEQEEESSSKLLTSGFPETTRRVERLSFDMTHISPPIANLFRRLITTEVPTLALDRVLIEENDSVVVDELLSHRLGLVPVAGPVTKMEFITEESQAGFNNLDSLRVLVFELTAEGAKGAALTPVYSRELKWVPLPGQEEYASPDVDDNDRVFIVHPDILLTKLGPGQRLKLRAIAVKGIGAVHTKWSPVSTCYYEMKTGISFSEPITGAAAEQLVQSCPMGVFTLENGAGKKKSAVVADELRCTLCRECLRQDAYPDFANKVKIEKDKTSVRFHLESTGQLYPAQIFRLALTLFASRARDLAQLIQSTEVNVMDTIAKPLH